MQADVGMGPLITKASLERVEQMVNKAVSEGAKVLCGGKRPANLKKGFFYEGTVLSNCRRIMEIIRKEIFGPVLPVVTLRPSMKRLPWQMIVNMDWPHQSIQPICARR